MLIVLNRRVVVYDRVASEVSRDMRIFVALMFENYSLLPVKWTDKNLLFPI
jgi:hypothetical protein